MERKTSFGSLEVLLEKEGEVVTELLKFNREGRGHTHDYWENCYVLDGQGIILIDDKQVQVQKGSVCKIPPGANHWMRPEGYLEIFIVYSEE
jgi:quercetin dioxygenase-like cupin family protein